MMARDRPGVQSFPHSYSCSSSSSSSSSSLRTASPTCPFSRCPYWSLLASLLSSLLLLLVQQAEAPKVLILFSSRIKLHYRKLVCKPKCGLIFNDKKLTLPVCC
ncbi:uncharacterized protein LOC143040457 [Oratosquilla oratoria]|uniref:uncharacterized protein LOC143040457 n=1 Tax=Oratosquilla oratoria TaxID=337810 RepID=UPI003F7779AD